MRKPANPLYRLVAWLAEHIDSPLLGRMEHAMWWRWHERTYGQGLT